MMEVLRNFIQVNYENTFQHGGRKLQLELADEKGTRWKSISYERATMQQAAMGSFRFCVGLFVKCDLVWMIKWRNFSHDSHPTQTGSFYEWNLWVYEEEELYCVIEGWGCCLYMSYLFLRNQVSDLFGLLAA